MRLEDKYKKLIDILLGLKEVIIGFSGGVDSSFLLKVAYDTLGDKAIGITVHTPMYPKMEMEFAKKISRKIGVTQVIINIEDGNEIIKFNPVDRCYICKKNIFGKIKEESIKYNITKVLDGSNLDDLKMYRPGKKALEELGIHSPLAEAMLTKRDIRMLSKQIGLETYDKPSFSCLMTRFEYGEEVTKEKLSMIESCEQYLNNLGLKNYRVRKHSNLCRIELSIEEIEKIFSLEIIEKIKNEFKSLGFEYVTLDLSGYKSGSMDIHINE